jgi:hypothetical protein
VHAIKPPQGGFFVPVVWRIPRGKIAARAELLLRNP